MKGDKNTSLFIPLFLIEGDIMKLTKSGVRMEVKRRIMLL